MRKEEVENPAAVKIENTTMKRGESVSVEMGAGGGFIARFSEK